MPNSNSWISPVTTPTANVDQQQRPEEAGQATVGVVAVAVPGGLQQRHQERQPDRDGHEEEVVDARAGELPAREVQRVHGVSLPSLRTASLRSSRRSAARSAGAALAGRASSALPVVHLLVPPQPGIATTGAHELGVRAAFGDPAAVEDDDLVHFVQPCQTVRDEERRTALGEGQKVVGEGIGRRGVEVLRRLVEDEDGKFGQEGARATATRWRCPPERRVPAVPTCVARPLGRPASQSPRPTRSSTSMSSSSLAERRPTRRFSARLVVKRCGLCSTSPTTRRTSSDANRFIGTPSRRASPASTGRKRTRTSASVDLPAPLCPTRATRRPGTRSRSTPRSTGRSAPG